MLFRSGEGGFDVDSAADEIGIQDNARRRSADFLSKIGRSSGR